jgi:hypothetical protein
MSMIGFPLLLIPFAVYNIFVFLMPGVAFTSPIASVTLMSGATWTATFGDALLAFSLMLLLVEVIKAARPGARYLTDHLLSLVAFGAAVAEFLLLAPFATSTFFLLTVLMGVEFLAGVSIGFRGRRRAVAVPAPVEVETPHPPAAPIIEPAARAPQPAEPTFTPAAPAAEPAAPAPAPEPIKAAPTFEAAPTPPVPDVHVDPAPAPRSVADWKVSDLVSDKDTDGSPGPASKP